MNGKIWLIGGTSDSATIAQMLLDSDIPFIVTVTTKTACSLYPTAEIAVGRMNRVEMESFCQKQGILAVVDASHPYAVEVSHLAIAVTAKANLPYLRYERVNYPASKAISTQTNITELASFDDLVAGDYLQDRRVLLTVGCKALPLFKAWQSKTVLFARILPKTSSLETALTAGFKCDRLIAIRPPLDLALEKALWQQWRINLVVTKASGTAGGEDVKRQVAADLDIPLIIITRPQVIYPRQISVFAEVVTFCQVTALKRDRAF